MLLAAPSRSSDSSLAENAVRGRPTRSRKGRRMRKILVTAVGGGVGQSIIKALQDTDYGIVGIDADELAAGLYGVPSAHKGCHATDEDFLGRLVEVSQEEGCELIFPGVELELLPLAAGSELLKAGGIIPVVSSPEVIRICDDKLETNAFLRRHGFMAPGTHCLSDVHVPKYPAILKPRRGGARSMSTYVARNSEEFDIYRRLVDSDNCVVQEYVEGDEYTCGTVTLGGKCFGVIVMRRTLRAGDTYKAFVERDERIESVVHDVVEALGAFGACNVQLRMRDGEPLVFEINARCSGTTAARALVGFNEPRMIADYLLLGVEPSYSIQEVTVLRYWKELVVPNGKIELVARARHILGDGTTL